MPFPIPLTKQHFPTPLEKPSCSYKVLIQAISSCNDSYKAVTEARSDGSSIYATHIVAMRSRMWSREVSRSCQYTNTYCLTLATRYFRLLHKLILAFVWREMMPRMGDCCWADGIHLSPYIDAYARILTWTTVYI